MANEKENSRQETIAEKSRERFVTTDEKAQFEVFANGNLPRETIARWIKNDLSAVLSFVHGVLRDEKIFNALVDAYFERYKVMHEEKKDDKP